MSSAYFRVLLHFVFCSMQTNAMGVAENLLFSLVSFESDMENCQFRARWWPAFRNYVKGQVCIASSSLLLRKKFPVTEEIKLFSHCAVYYALALQFLRSLDLPADEQMEKWWVQNVYFCTIEAEVLLERMKMFLQSHGALCDVDTNFATAESLLSAFSLVFPSRFLSRMKKNCLSTTLSQPIVDTFPMPRHEFDRCLREFMGRSNTPDSLDRVLWIFKDFWNSQLSSLDCSDKFHGIISQLFDNLQCFPENFQHISIESISLLDIYVFLNRCVFEWPKTAEVSKLSYLPGDVLSNKWEREWYMAVLKLSRDIASGKDRVRVSDGLEVLRLRCNPEREIQLLISTVTLLDRLMMFMSKNNFDRQNIVRVSDYAVEYWKVIGRVVSSSRIPSQKIAADTYAPLTASDRDYYFQLSKYFQAVNNIFHDSNDDALKALEHLETPLALYGQYLAYKKKAEALPLGLQDSSVSTEKHSLLQKAFSSLQAFEKRIGEDIKASSCKQCGFSVDAEVIKAERTALDALLTKCSMPIVTATSTNHVEGGGARSTERGRISADNGGEGFSPASGSSQKTTADMLAEILCRVAEVYDYSVHKQSSSSSSDLKTVTDTLSATIHMWSTSMRELSQQIVEPVRQLTESNQKLVEEVLRLKVCGSDRLQATYLVTLFETLRF
ncbi:unnamed protein product [Soboliphyme baturini]|uniref:TPR_REGION domain-containing protein n=1 Tax=Soboliphyme baturini TaxID=241478 RepID=A0A183IRV8_9BILA|nr:unnamed protein product [Soboliphyme baturini]